MMRIVIVWLYPLFSFGGFCGACLLFQWLQVNQVGPAWFYVCNDVGVPQLGLGVSLPLGMLAVALMCATLVMGGRAYDEVFSTHKAPNT